MQFIKNNPFILLPNCRKESITSTIRQGFMFILIIDVQHILRGCLHINPLKHSVYGADKHTQNSQLLKYIPEILYDLFTFIICLQIAFTVLGIGLFLNSGRISA